MTQRAAPKKSRTPAAARKRAAGAAGPQADVAVDDFLRKLDHPLRADFQAVRRIILGASPSIREGIKWNSLSFRTHEWFATLNWRVRDRVQLVLHLGAKVRDNTSRLKIADPKGLLQWLSNDRALLTVGAGSELAARRTALASLVRAWIKHV